MGRLTLNILLSFAQFERELIRERVVAGISAAKARGVRFGRPVTASNHLDVVRKLFEAGESTRQIAARTGVPDPKSIATRVRPISESVCISQDAVLIDARKTVAVNSVNVVGHPLPPN